MNRKVKLSERYCTGLAKEGRDGEAEGQMDQR